MKIVHQKCASHACMPRLCVAWVTTRAGMSLHSSGGHMIYSYAYKIPQQLCIIIIIGIRLPYFTIQFGRSLQITK